MEIDLLPIGEVDPAVLSELKSRLNQVFGCPVSVGNSIPIPEEAFDSGRGQYLSDIFIEKLRPFARDKAHVLGVTEANLFTRGLNFVFGQADYGHGLAVISLNLLRPETHGLEPDNNILMERAVKEAVHELGHTFGIGHCDDGLCVMHFSNSLIDTDVKKAQFCHRCRPKLLP